MNSLFAIFQLNLRAERHFCLAAGFDDFGVHDNIFNFSNAALNKSLFFTCTVVLSILTQIAKVTCISDLFGNLATTTL
ncbi:hypothetical protein D3C85_1720970 [compost metagenome]